jgi:NAD-dependent deacetylase
MGSHYWAKYDLTDFTFHQFLTSEAKRKEYWRMEQEFYELVQTVRPNDVHNALAELERKGKLLAIITQNVDGLHQRAGNSKEKVIEIHGHIFTVGCLQCFKKYSREEVYQRIKTGIAVPYCSFCHGILKSDTIAFGQALVPEISARSLGATLQSDLFLVIGCSLLVQPAAYLVTKAKEAGAKVVMINFSATPYDFCADLVIYENAKQAMVQIMNELQALTPIPK